MAYNKKALKYAKRNKKKTYKKAATTKVVKKVLRQQEPYKYIVDSLSNSSVGTGWTNLLNISNITWSPEENPKYRCSTKTYIKNLCLSMKMEAATGDTTNQIRISIIRGRRSGALNLSNITYDPNSSGDNINLQFNQKYVEVLYDHTFNVQEIDTGSVYPPYRLLQKCFPINKLCKYIEAPNPATTYTTQPYNQSAIYLVACSDSTLTPNPRFSGQSRISFKDLD